MMLLVKVSVGHSKRALQLQHLYPELPVQCKLLAFFTAGVKYLDDLLWIEWSEKAR